MSLSYLPNVTTLQFDRDLCTGCGMCVEVCPHAVFRLEADHAVLVDRDACIECGVFGQRTRCCGTQPFATASATRSPTSLVE
jgi:ferredoxin